MNVFVVITRLQHQVLAPDKHGVHFPVLEGILNFLTLLFSINVPPIISFSLLFLLKAVIRCSWNNSRRFVLGWKMFQFLRTTAGRFGKNRLHVNINLMHFGSFCSQCFSCSRSSHKLINFF